VGLLGLQLSAVGASPLESKTGRGAKLREKASHGSRLRRKPRR
jgi:hypothetical protein